MISQYRFLSTGGYYGRLWKIKAFNPGGGNPLQEVTHSWDAGGTKIGVRSVNTNQRMQLKSMSKVIAFLTLAFVIGSLLVLGGACGELNLPLQIENQTNMALTIYIQEHEAGNVKPNSNVKIEGIPGTLAYYLIEAKNNKGDLIYSRKFSVSELHDADWKVVISLSRNK